MREGMRDEEVRDMVDEAKLLVRAAFDARLSDAVREVAAREAWAIVARVVD